VGCYEPFGCSTGTMPSPSAGPDGCFGERLGHPTATFVGNSSGADHVGESFENAAVTVDWFHVVQQLFTKAVDEVRPGLCCMDVGNGLYLCRMSNSLIS
jgi:hypothetical protein